MVLPSVAVTLWPCPLMHRPTPMNMSPVQICTCNLCGCGAIMDTVFAVMAAGWWVVGAVVISTVSTAAGSCSAARRHQHV